MPNPYTPTAYFNDLIWARAFNTETSEDLNCDSITSFNLKIYKSPTPETPSAYQVCDDDKSGSDTDGIFNEFILNTKDQEILFNLETNLYAVSYHTSANGAQTSATTDVIDKNVNYINTTRDTQLIYVRVEDVNNSDCFDASKSFKLEVKSRPIINSEVALKQCDDDTDGYSDFNLTEANSLISENSTSENFTYFLSENGAINSLASAQISNTTAFNNRDNNTVWARVENTFMCYRVARINLLVSTSQIPNTFKREIATCDDFLDINGNDNENNNDNDGISSFDFTATDAEIKALFPSNQEITITYYRNQEDALAEENVITDISDYRNINSPTLQDIYVRVDNEIDNSCIGLGAYIRIKVNQITDFTVTSPQIICLNNTPLTLRVENPEDIYEYQWKDSDGNNLGTEATQEVTTGGDYKITATKTSDTNCSRTKTITVNESDVANIDIDDVTIIDDSNNNSISINATDDNLGPGDYEFALLNEAENGILQYQDEPFFEQLTGGIYTIAVRDKNSCGTATLTVPILEFPKFFTPNGDGIKDIWFIKGATTDFFPKSSIHIFNRYGKILVKIPLGYGWNGVFNSKKLPSNDYWYSIQLEDKDGNIRNKTGHFTLLRH